MHGGKKKEWPPLRKGSAVEQGKDTCIVGHTSTDLRVDEPAVALDGGGEAAEVVGQRQLEHAGQKLAGSRGLMAPKKKQRRTRRPTGRPPRSASAVGGSDGRVEHEATHQNDAAAR